MKISIVKSSIVFLIFLVSCKEAEIQNIDIDNVIISAEILSFNDLHKDQKDNLQYCCTYYLSNWRDGVEFKKEDAYFVKAKINNEILAQLSESNAKSKEELLSVSENYLYGKYRNRWEFIDQTGFPIYETEKFEGFRILEIIRNKNIDEIVIGPIPKRPIKMFIKILDSKNYPDLKPEYEIK